MRCCSVRCGAVRFCSVTSIRNKVTHRFKVFAYLSAIEHVRGFYCSAPLFYYVTTFCRPVIYIVKGVYIYIYIYIYIYTIVIGIYIPIHISICIDVGICTGVNIDISINHKVAAFLSTTRARCLHRYYNQISAASKYIITLL